MPPDPAEARSLPDQGDSAAVAYIANCPEHGLHGERDDCFVCGKEVQHTVFVRSSVYLDVRGRLERERDELRRAEKRQCNRADKAEDYVNERDETIAALRAENETLKEEQIAFVRDLEKAQAEHERLKGLQRWRACGGDRGAPPDCDPWRSDLDTARSDASQMKTGTKPPFEHVWVETCWMSEPERVESPLPSDED